MFEQSPRQRQAVSVKQSACNLIRDWQLAAQQRPALAYPDGLCAVITAVPNRSLGCRHAGTSSLAEVKGRTLVC